MMILSDEELEAIRESTYQEFMKALHEQGNGKRDPRTFGRAIEAAVLAKLASAELPEIVGNAKEFESDTHQQWCLIRSGDACNCDTGYTADQLRQAYAQGAAAQLAEKPTCWVTPDGEGFRMRLSPPVNAVPLGWQELYTRREA